MRKFVALPPEAQVFVEDHIRRGTPSFRTLSGELLERFGVERSKSWLASYVRRTLRPQLERDAQLTRRLRLLKDEFADRPEVLEHLVSGLLAISDESAPPMPRRRSA